MSPVFVCPQPLPTRRPLAVLAVCLWLVGTTPLQAKSAEQELIRQALQAGQISEGAKRLKAELQRQPRDIDLRLLEGVYQARSGQKDKAIETFKKIAADHPALPEAHNNLGVLYAERNELALAKAAFERALATIPSYAASHKNLMDLNTRLAKQAYARAFRQEEGAAPLAAASLLLLPIVGGAPLPDPTPANQPAVVTAPAKEAIPLALVPNPPPAPAPAPAAVAPPVKRPPAGAAPAAPATASASASSTEVAAIDKAVKDWAGAWSKKNVAQYLEAYSPNFEPPNRQSRQNWAKDRRVRIEQRKFIRVGVSGLQIEVKGTQAQVRLEQAYESDGLNSSSRKTLDLVKEGGRWLILREKLS